jgi:hypothetical protein
MGGSQLGRTEILFLRSGLIAVALTTFALIGIPAAHAESKPDGSTSAAEAQYGPFTPPTTPAPTAGVQPATGPSSPTAGQPGASAAKPAAKPAKPSTKPLRAHNSAPFKPPAARSSAPVKPQLARARPTQAPGPRSTAQPGKSSALPFTGLALWVPLAIGLVLMAAGVTLRTRGRRGRRSTH